MRPACVRQRGKADCGPAALATIALHHGRPVTLARAARLCRAGPGGATLLGLVEAARRLGFRAEVVLPAAREVGSLPLPAIVHLHSDGPHEHLAVVHAVDDETVLVADPDSGLGRWRLEEFEARYTGHTVLLEPDPALSGDPAGPGAWTLLAGWSRPHRTILVGLALSGLAIAALATAAIHFLGRVVDGASPWPLVAVVVTLGALGHGRARWLATLQRRLAADLALRIHGAAIGSGDVGGLVEAFREIGRIQRLAGALVPPPPGIAFLLPSLALAASADLTWGAALAAAGTASVALAAAERSAARDASASESAGFAAWAELRREIERSVAAITPLQLLPGHAASQERAVLESCERHARAVHRAPAMHAFAAVLRTIGFLGLLALGVAGVHRGRGTPGLVAEGLAIAFLARRSGEGLLQLADALPGAADATLAIADREGVPAAAEPPGTPGVLLEEVVVAYGYGRPVLRGLTLRASPGEAIGIHGGPGSGKSTLARTLLGLAAPIDGKVARPGAVAHAGGPTPSGGSIRDELLAAGGAPDAGEVRAALGLVGLGAWSDRLDEPAPPEVAGRLALARVVLARPALAVLDEALGPPGEGRASVLGALRRELPGTIWIVIERDPALLEGVDRVHRLEAGRLV